MLFCIGCIYTVFWVLWISPWLVTAILPPISCFHHEVYFWIVFELNTAIRSNLLGVLCCSVLFCAILHCSVMRVLRSLGVLSSVTWLSFLAMIHQQICQIFCWFDVCMMTKSWFLLLLNCLWAKYGYQINSIRGSVLFCVVLCHSVLFYGGCTKISGCSEFCDMF